MPYKSGSIFNELDLHSRSLWPAVTMFGYERVMVASKSCKCGEYGSFEDWLFLFYLCKQNMDLSTGQPCQPSCFKCDLLRSMYLDNATCL